MVAITGATGQTGSKIANFLLDNNKKIRVICRTEDKLNAFKKRGAEIAVGDQSDLQFLTNALKNCDAMYLMIPPKIDTPDTRKYYNLLGDTAIEAIRKSGVKKVVFLSSIGAELDVGTGPVLGLHDLENKLNALTQIDLVTLRPAYFMENFLVNIPLIKQKRISGSAMPPNVPFAMIATRDIAKKAAELLTTQAFSGHTIIELFGDRISCKDATRLIGEAVGIPDLPYVHFSDEDTVKSMTGMGFSENLARSLVEMTASIGKGLFHPTQIDPLKPNTNTTFKSFVDEVFKPEFKVA
jgi:uncharacterized protein YbjT (DUF2867 family)